MNQSIRQPGLLFSLGLLVFVLGITPCRGQEAATGPACVDCHATDQAGAEYTVQLSHSIHDGLGCTDCHTGWDAMGADGMPVHATQPPSFQPGYDGCAQCHVDAAEQYKRHGRYDVGSTPDLPKCSSCHGSHGILPSAAPLSMTYPSNLPNTCGTCHEDLNLTTKYEMLFNQAVEVYQSSVHGKATQAGVFVAATCNDCHSTGGTAHRILSPDDPESSINHFNIPGTCGKCHRGVENEYWEGIHGKLVRRGETDSPVCTHCHGEHGILAADDPRSPVSPARVAESTCSPCHESARLNEKYGVASGRLATFIDSYHGLKSMAGDNTVANCASCHGEHRILPSSDPTSTINPKNLSRTCGQCHPGISEELANSPIHGVGGVGLRTPLADAVEKVYIVAIFVIIGLMVVHWLLDLFRHVSSVIKARPQIRRMRADEVWQHALLMISFIVLVMSGFSLRYAESWFARLLFGWRGGFELRGLVHRVSAVIFILTVLWHIVFLVTGRGRQFVGDMLPAKSDFSQFWDRILYNLGRRKQAPRFGRFSYVEKAEYWALVWGTAVMVVTGLMLWFDNTIIHFVPKGVLDVALVVHFWEAWLATLAIVVWHMYSTVFSPHVYPMNPSWLTGTMPESMYKHEHPEHAEEARRETDQHIRKQIASLEANESPASGSDDDTHEGDNADPEAEKQSEE